MKLTWNQYTKIVTYTIPTSFTSPTEYIPKLPHHFTKNPNSNMAPTNIFTSSFQSLFLLHRRMCVNVPSSHNAVSSISNNGYTFSLLYFILFLHHWIMILSESERRSHVRLFSPFHIPSVTAINITWEVCWWAATSVQANVPLRYGISRSPCTGCLRKKYGVADYQYFENGKTQ